MGLRCLSRSLSKADFAGHDAAAAKSLTSHQSMLVFLRSDPGRLGAGEMERCFVIQPFDGSSFDDRFDSVLKPALAAAGLEAYRVDRDPKVSIPIQDIEREIRDARICLADISIDNPNVWFELGFAIAAYKNVVLICSDLRQQKFPFDVQHRTIIRYKTGSPQDFQALANAITERAEALLTKEERVSAAAELSKLSPVEGLEQHEVVALAALGENLASTDGGVSMWSIRQDMEKAGFTSFAISIAMKALLEHDLISEEVLTDDRDESPYSVYSFTDAGWRWVMSNKDRFALRRKSVLRHPVSFADDVPF